jgi:DNA-3-methyladenine glycosylase II
VSARVELPARGPYRLSEAVRVFGDWLVPSTADGQGLALAMVLDGYEGVAGVAVREEAGEVAATVSPGADPAAAARQAARALSLDRDGTAYPEVGARDPVVGALMAQAPGLRPVCFGTPYEAGAWAILSQRTSMAHARRMRERLSGELGRPVAVDGRERRAFPLPADLLAADAVPGVPAVKAGRLRSLAEAALDGRLDAGTLRALPPDEARAELRTLPGIGPFSADLMLIRGCGAVDVFCLAEPRLHAVMARAYGVPEDDDGALLAVAEGWRPFRTWVGVLLRAIG